MGLFGSDPLGGGHLEEVYLELRARTEKLRSDLKEGFDEIKNAGEDLQQGPMSSIVGGIFSIGDAAEVAIGNIAVMAVAKLFEMVNNVVDSVEKLAYNFIADGVQINASLQPMIITFTNLLGNQKAALGFMQKLREEGAAFGQQQEVLQAGKSLLPYANGDIQTFEKLLTLAKQLSVAMPQQGFQGAAFAIREALSGQTRSLLNRFDLKTSNKELLELYHNFSNTQDIDKFVDALSEVVGRSGATKESIEAMSNTTTASINKIQFSFSELERIAGMPVFAAFQKHISEFSELFNANFTSMEQVALRVGAVIAVLIDYIVETVRATISIASKIGNFFDGLRESFINILSDAITAYAQFWASIFNIKIDASGLKEKLKTALGSALGSSEELKKAFGGIDIDFTQRVKAYEDMFKDMLDTSQNGWDTLNNSDQKGQGENIAQYFDYFNKLRDVIESNNDDIQKAQKDHEKKLDDIEKNAEKARQKAKQDYDSNLAKLHRDTQINIRNTDIDYNNQTEDIEKQHAEKLKQIQNDLNSQLFDAVNARDAKRVYEILQSGKKQTNAENQQYKDQKDQAKIDHDRKIAQIRLDEQDKQKELQLSLNKQLDQIRQNQIDARNEENDSYKERLRTLHDALVAKLKQIARGWADEGKLTADGLKIIMQMLSSVYGPNGDYLQLIEAFNAELAQQALITQKTLAGMGSGSGSKPEPIGNPNDPNDPHNNPEYKKSWLSDITHGYYHGTFDQWLKDHGYITAESGFEGIISKPTAIFAGEKFKPEKISITPLTGSSASKASMGDNLHVTLDARGVSRDFEALVAGQLSELLADAINKKRRN